MQVSRVTVASLADLGYSVDLMAADLFSPLPGDANLDLKVDANDLNLVGLNWRQNVSCWCSGDFNGDGRVDALDLNAVTSNWRIDVSGEAAAANAQQNAIATLEESGHDQPVKLGLEP